MHESTPSYSLYSGRNLDLSISTLHGTSLSLNTLTSFFIKALYSLTADSITYSTIFSSSFLHLTFTSGSINLISPYTNIYYITSYLNEEVFAKFLILSLIVGQLLHHLVLSFFVKFLNQSIDSLHLLDSCGILLS